MRITSIILSSIAAAMLCFAVVTARAATAGADLADNEKPDGASDWQNPNYKHPEWSYGYRTSVAGPALTLFTAANHTDGFDAAGINEPMEGFNLPGTIPAVLVNTGPTDYTMTYGAGPFGPKEMMVHGGGMGTWAVVRYTVPAGGLYSIAAHFRSSHGGDVDVHLVVNGTSIFDQTLAGWGSTARSIGNLALNAGDAVDFVVGRGNNNDNDSAAFDATITTGGVALTADGDYEAQTLGTGLGAPWNLFSGGGSFTVDAAGQSPFTNLFANNGKGASHVAVSGNPYFVQQGFNVAAGAKGYLSLNFDFRNTTADGDCWTAFVTKDADANLATVGLAICGTGFYAKSSSGWGPSVFTPAVGEWYHVQLLLDLNDNGYSGTVVTHSTGATMPITRRGFCSENDINTIFSDGQSDDGSGGTAPGHNIDNFALSTYVPAARVATAGADLAANEKPDGASDRQNPNPTYPQWRYGYRSSVAGMALTLFTAADHTDNFVDANDPMEGFHIHGGSSVPAVLVNTGTEPFTFSFFAGLVGPSEIMMHGTETDYAVVRYTIPSARTYSVRAHFRSIDIHDSEAHVVVNGTPLFDRVLAGWESAKASFGSLALKAGDVVDFVVGIGGSFGGDSTAFDATITPDGVVLTADGDFGAQTLGGALGAPWNGYGGGGGSFTVNADGQSPFTNLFPDNGKGVSHPAAAENPYFVQGGFNVPASTRGYLCLNFDFRNTTAEGDGWTLFLAKDADFNQATAGLVMSSTGFYTRSSDGWSGNLFAPGAGEWYHVQLVLDMNSNTYSGTVVSHTTGVMISIPSRGFYSENDINTIYSDGASDEIQGIAPGHNIDNLALTTYVPAARAASAGPDLAANEKPDGAGSLQNPNHAYPQWSYGFRTSVGGTALTLFTAAEHTDSFIALNDPMEGFYIHNGFSIPAVLVNTDPTPFTFSFGAGPVGPQEMMMHGDVGKWAVVRYTIPVAGAYDVTASFRAIHGGDADAHVVINGTSLFDQVLPSGQSASHTVSNRLFKAGDVVDFVVGINGVLDGDSTAFNGMVAPVVPLCGAVDLGTRANQPAILLGDRILAGCSDPDGDTRSLLSVSQSTNGAVVTFLGGNVTYTPQTDFVGLDRFSYTVTDGRGNISTGVVEVLVRPGNVASLNIVSRARVGDNFQFTFAGIPGLSYQVERALQVTGPWTNLGTIVAQPHGLTTFVDTNLPSGSAYYRTVYP